jgi:kynureninase
MPHAKEVCAELLKRDVVVDWRPQAGVRFSPHFYNTDEELAQALKTVDEILAEGRFSAKPQPAISVG